MELLSTLILLIIGILAGAIGTWLVTQAKSRQAVAEAVSEVKTQVASLESQLSSREQEIKAVREELNAIKLPSAIDKSEWQRQISFPNGRAALSLVEVTLQKRRGIAQLCARRSFSLIENEASEKTGFGQ